MGKAGQTGLALRRCTRYANAFSLVSIPFVLLSSSQSSRIRSSENNIQLSDGRGGNANVQQAAGRRDRESCGHHGIRLVEGVVRVHITGGQNGTGCTAHHGASKRDLVSIVFDKSGLTMVSVTT
jgi:hypothetical protein